MTARKKPKKSEDRNGGGTSQIVPISLWSYIASAVNGPKASIQTGSFQQGMYFALLSWGVE
jgi:hypothetical protein